MNLFQPLGGNNRDSFGHRAQELDGPAHPIGHQAVHVGHALGQAASQMGHKSLPCFVHHTGEQHLRGPRTCFRKEGRVWKKTKKRSPQTLYVWLRTPGAGEREEERGVFVKGEESTGACRFLGTRPAGLWTLENIKGETTEEKEDCHSLLRGSSRFGIEAIDLPVVRPQVRAGPQTFPC